MLQDFWPGSRPAICTASEKAEAAAVSSLASVLLCAGICVDGIVELIAGYNKIPVSSCKMSYLKKSLFMNRSGPWGSGAWAVWVPLLPTLTGADTHRLPAQRWPEEMGELGSVHRSTVDMECGFQSFSPRRKSWWTQCYNSEVSADLWLDGSWLAPGTVHREAEKWRAICLSYPQAGRIQRA